MRTVNESGYREILGICEGAKGAAGYDAIHLVPGVRGTSGGRDGEEKKMAQWAPRLMLMSGSLGRRGQPCPGMSVRAGRGTGHGRPILWQLRNSGDAQASPVLPGEDKK